MPYAINVPAGVENVDRYVAAAKAHIKANAAKGKRQRWLEANEDAQRLYDWLNQCGEFATTRVTRNPEDQAAYEAAINALDVNDSYFFEARDEIDEAFDVVYKSHPATEGMFAGSFGEVLLNMRDNLDEWGSLTEKQTAMVRKALARKEAWVAESEKRIADAKERDAGSEFVGEVKERREWTLVVRKVLDFDTQFGILFIHVMGDDNNNVIVYKGSKRLGDRGETIKVKATIKSHETREGVKQTLIARPAAL